MKRFVIAMSIGSVLPVAILVMLSAALPVFAQSMNPCTEDMKTICGDITMGGGRLLRCYEERKDKISTDCRGWVEGAKANADVLRKACSKEIDARCNSEKGDPLEMLDCLQSNYIDLSMGCREKLNAFKGRYPKPVQ
jgi:hypothetical protein